jgi:hypothetical protein
MAIKLQETFFPLRREIHPRCEPRGLFHPEVGGDIFLGNVGCYKNYAASYPRLLAYCFIAAETRAVDPEGSAVVRERRLSTFPCQPKHGVVVTDMHVTIELLKAMSSVSPYLSVVRQFLVACASVKMLTFYVPM